MKFNRILTLALAMLLVFSLAACGGNNNPTEPATTDPTPTEAPAADTNMNYFSLSMGADYENVTSLTAYLNDDGSVAIEYNGEVRKVGTVDKAALNTIAAAFEATGLSELVGQDAYEEGTASGSMYVTYLENEETVYTTVDFGGIVPEAFSTGFAAMQTVFQTLTAEIPEYVPQPMVNGVIADNDRAALDAIMANMTIANPEGYAINGIEVNADLPYAVGLSTEAGIVSAVSFGPMMMTQPYSLNIVTVAEGTDPNTVAQDFVDSLNWQKWVCVAPTNALVAINGNQVLCLMASESFTADAAAIETAGWTTFQSLENPEF